MSVLIKGIGIPKSCSECRFCVNGFTDKAPVYECACESYENVSVLVDDHGKPFDFRPDWCPLIEVQSPHGRLIDADALMIEIMDSDLDHLQRDDWKEVIQIVADAPTNIEAEVEDVSSRIRQLARQAGKILVDAALNAIKESEGSERQ